jgi:hypothetical protein
MAYLIAFLAVLAAAVIFMLWCMGTAAGPRRGQWPK